MEGVFSDECDSCAIYKKCSWTQNLILIRCVCSFEIILKIRVKRGFMKWKKSRCVTFNGLSRVFYI